jgi:putative oxidoreductase
MTWSIIEFLLVVLKGGVYRRPLTVSVSSLADRVPSTPRPALLLTTRPARRSAEARTSLTLCRGFLAQETPGRIEPVGHTLDLGVLPGQIVQQVQFRRWGTVAMIFDEFARVLGRMILAIAVVMIVVGLGVVLFEHVTAWFAISATIAMAALLLSAYWQLSGTFTSIAAMALATAVVFRLFSILRLHSTIATGPGVPGFEPLGWFLGALVFIHFIVRAIAAASSAESREATIDVLALTFIRIYAALMFTPYFCNHILGGPDQFQSPAVPMPATHVLVAGSIELVSAVGLTLGLLTRPVALLASAYLLISMSLGRHFEIGNVGAMPQGGYEFGLFWAVTIAVFVVVGGGRASLDCAVRQSSLFDRRSWLRAAALLFA